MGYIEKSLAEGERVLRAGRLHWIVYARSIALALLGVAVALVGHRSADPNTIFGTDIAGLLLVLVGCASWLRAWIDRATTEIAATTRRFVVKRGLIWRSMMEIGAGQVESVRIHQSVLGRLLGYGTLVVAGTGSGIDPVKSVDNPLALRRALDQLYRQN